MNVTPAQIRQAYAFLRSVPPFSRWSLPPPESVRFYLLNDVSTHAQYIYNRKPEISVNADTHLTLNQLFASVAHEMVHLRQELTGKLPAIKDPHNAAFRRAAKQVCHHLGFDVQHF